MIEEMDLELAALRLRAEDISFMMIEATGKLYFELAGELEHVEHEIEEKEYEMSEITNIYDNEGIV